MGKKTGVPPRTVEEEVRVFWSRVDKDLDFGGCWLWVAGTGSHGYGMLRWEGRNQTTHRISWMLAHGPVPKGLYVLHTCDVRRCVNPSHLYVGTPLDNMNDKIARGRSNQPFGERAGKHKLTEAQIIEIRELFSNGAGTRELARRYGIARNSMNAIKQGRSWKHLITNGSED